MMQGGIVRFRKRYVVIAFLAIGFPYSYGSPTLTEFTLDAGIAGVVIGTFNVGVNQLKDVSELSGSGNTFNYVSQFFNPSSDGTYIFGMSSAPVDTVMILYANSHDPSSPSTNAVELNDDRVGSPPPGVTILTCGTQGTTCPQMTAALSGSTDYYVVITTYAAGDPIALPMEFYVYGEPISVGGETPVDPGGGGSSGSGGSGGSGSSFSALGASEGGPASGVAKVIDSNASLKALFVAANLSTGPQASRAVAQTLPLLTGGSMIAAQSALSGINRIIQARIDGSAGLSSGDDFYEDRNLWMKSFGSWAKQNDHKGVSGFKIDTYGLAVGLDGALSSSLRLGLAFAYSDMTIKSNATAASQRSDVAVHQMIGYGSYGFDGQTEINFQFDAGINYNKGKREIEFVSAEASSDYISYSAHTGVGIGRIFYVWPRTSISPSARVDYTWIKDKAYSETGAGLLNLDVESRSAEALLLGIEGKLAHQLNDYATLTARLGLGYDAINEQSSVSASFSSIPGTLFTTHGTDPVPWLGTAGLDAIFQVGNGLEIMGRYDHEYRGSFVNQSALIKLRWSF